MITISLTKSQVENLKEFFECEFIPSIQRNTDCDNINYLVDMCDIYKMLDNPPVKFGLDNPPEKGGVER